MINKMIHEGISNNNNEKKQRGVSLADLVDMRFVWFTMAIAILPIIGGVIVANGGVIANSVKNPPPQKKKDISAIVSKYTVENRTTTKDGIEAIVRKTGTKEPIKVNYGIVHDNGKKASYLTLQHGTTYMHMKDYEGDDKVDFLYIARGGYDVVINRTIGGGYLVKGIGAGAEEVTAFDNAQLLFDVYKTKLEINLNSAENQDKLLPDLPF